MFPFETLISYKKTIGLTRKLFDLCNKLPSKYQFSIGDQLRRAVLSISNNIAEGSGRRTIKDRNSFWIIARGSALEVVNIIIVCYETELITAQEKENILTEITEIIKLLYAMTRNNTKL